jgi:hypothetical protein
MIHGTGVQPEQLSLAWRAGRGLAETYRRISGAPTARVITVQIPATESGLLSSVHMGPTSCAWSGKLWSLQKCRGPSSEALRGAKDSASSG